MTDQTDENTETIIISGVKSMLPNHSYRIATSPLQREQNRCQLQITQDAGAFGLLDMMKTDVSAENKIEGKAIVTAKDFASVALDTAYRLYIPVLVGSLKEEKVSKWVEFVYVRKIN